MTRSVIAGAWYGCFLPSGEFCATIPQVHVVTHAGPIAFPPHEPWGIGFPRCTNINGFRFAGQAHSTTDPACWEYDPAAGGWVDYPPLCLGTQPTIYDNDGVLHRNMDPDQTLGYRYVTPSNQIVTGNATYGPFHGLFEYTDLGDGLWIGHAAYDGGGVQVWDGAVLRQLELGTGQWVNANRDGETVALAFTQPYGVVLVLTTMAELRALPAAVPPVPPNPGPVPPVDFPPLFPLPQPPQEHPMEPFTAAFQIGVHVARVDRHGTAPWPGWFPIRFDRADTSDPDTHFTISQPESGNPRLMAKAQGGGFLTADFTEFGGSVCDGFYCSPEPLGWGAYQQWNGWQLAANGPEVVLVQYQDPARVGECSPSLTLVRL